MLVLWLATWCLLGGKSEAGRIGTGEIYDRARAASVQLLVDGQVAGSAWFADEAGYLITAGHAVDTDNKTKLEIVAEALERRPVQVVAIDAGHDLALLKAPARDEPYPSLPLAGGMPEPGQAAFLYGTALFRRGIMTRGAVARRDSTFEFLAANGGYAEVYHFSAASPKGTSGGCWLNRRGEVIAAQSAFVGRDGQGVGLAIAAPVSAIQRLVKTKESPVTPTLGTGFEELVTQQPGFIERFPEGTRGLVPVVPTEGGPAKKAGLTGEFVITHVDDRAMPRRDALLRYIRRQKPGDEVTIRVIHPDSHEVQRITVTLGEL